jgi:hypothetical protein
MRRYGASLAMAAVVAVFVASPAFAKGPQRALVTGPGLPDQIKLADDVPFIFFMSRPGGQAVLPHRPDGPLGPRFTVTYPAI